MVYTIDEIKAKIIPIAKQYNLSKVYLFGSYARGEADEKSDVDIAIELNDESSYFDVYGKLLTLFDGEIDILLVSDLLSPKTYIGKLVKQNFLNDREVIYGTMVENLDNNPRMRDITEYNEVTQNAIKESLEKYKTEGITKSSESIDNYFERMVRENTK